MVKIKTYFAIFFVALLIQLSSAQVAGQTGIQGGTTNWTTKPFDQKVFIKNEGQFDAFAENGDKILYGARLGKVFGFITTHGIVYEYTDCPKQVSSDKDRDEEEAEAQAEPAKHYLYATWQGSTNDISTLAAQEQSWYSTYVVNNVGIKANVFKKITCTNVYPGIDVEFTFPEDENRLGFEYSFIVHPGADASLIKINYSGEKNMTIGKNGNIKIETGWGSFTDYAPVAYYRPSSCVYTMPLSYKLNNGTESFSVHNNYPDKTLVIDPYTVNWTQNPAILTSDAYDVDYDYAGNVYACGTTDMIVVKMNSAGTTLWTYNGNTIFNQTGFYGHFCVDKIHQSVYICNGIPKQSPLGPALLKLTSAGVYVTDILNTTLMYEYWRARYDQCSNQVIIAGGGATGNNDVLRIDSSLATPVYLNPFFPTSSLYQDLSGMAIDPTGKLCYMLSSSGDESTHNNHIVQMPMPNLASTNWNVADGFTFNELCILYTGLIDNGMNCMAASLNYLYCYDGKTVKEYNPATGANLLTATMPASASYKDGGIDVDLCDNVYIGNLKTVYVYNSALTQTATIGPLTNTIFDVKLGQRQLSGYDSLLYVCGGNFVSSISLNLPAPGPQITKTHVTGCGCTSTATATLNFCGVPYTSNVTYNWSNGQHTQTATGLCLGNTYTVTIDFGCTNQFTDTFKMQPACVLPVELESFTATCNDDYPLLQWTTATETNDNYFTLDRTQDNISYQTVGTVKGAGNSNFAHNYSLIDYNPFEGTSYYRLSQTDMDGAVNYLGTIPSTFCSPEDNVNAFVSQNSTINISINTQSGEAYTFVLTDILGRTILTQTRQAVSGMNTFKLNPQVAAGIYILQINGTQRVLCKKLVLGGGL